MDLSWPSWQKCGSPIYPFKPSVCYITNKTLNSITIFFLIWTSLVDHQIRLILFLGLYFINNSLCTVCTVRVVCWSFASKEAMLKNDLNDLIFIFNCICYIGFVNLVILYDYELVSTESLRERCDSNDFLWRK